MFWYSYVAAVHCVGQQQKHHYTYQEEQESEASTTSCSEASTAVIASNSNISVDAILIDFWRKFDLSSRRNLRNRLIINMTMNQFHPYLLLKMGKETASRVLLHLRDNKTTPWKETVIKACNFVDQMLLQQAAENSQCSTTRTP